MAANPNLVSDPTVIAAAMVVFYEDAVNEYFNVNIQFPNEVDLDRRHQALEYMARAVDEDLLRVAQELNARDAATAQQFPLFTGPILHKH